MPRKQGKEERKTEEKYKLEAENNIKNHEIEIVESRTTKKARLQVALLWTSDSVLSGDHEWRPTDLR